MLFRSTTVDNESVLMQDGGDDQTSARTNLALAYSKSLDGTHTLNDGTTVDTESVTMGEPVYLNPDNSGRYGISTFAAVKTIDSTTYNHYLNDGVTLDSDVQTISDTDATSATDLNRTTPAFTITGRLLDSTTTPHYLYDGVTADNDTTTPVDSGGTFLVNPYAEAGWFLNDGGVYVGTPINF